MRAFIFPTLLCIAAFTSGVLASDFTPLLALNSFKIRHVRSQGQQEIDGLVPKSMSITMTLKATDPNQDKEIISLKKTATYTTEGQRQMLAGYEINWSDATVLPVKLASSATYDKKTNIFTIVVKGTKHSDGGQCSVHVAPNLTGDDGVTLTLGCTSVEKKEFNVTAKIVGNKVTVDYPANKSGKANQDVVTFTGESWEWARKEGDGYSYLRAVVSHAVASLLKDMKPFKLME